jgi:hypothetical protein
MGTVAVFRNVRIVIFPRDHEPPHIHAIGPGAEAVFRLNNLELIRSRGFDSRAVEKIRQFLETRRNELLEAWNEIHE